MDTLCVSKIMVKGVFCMYQNEVDLECKSEKGVSYLLFVYTTTGSNYHKRLLAACLFFNSTMQSSCLTLHLRPETLNDPDACEPKGSLYHSAQTPCAIK